MSTLRHEKLDGTADNFWELGTRDTGAFATFSAVVEYLDWLGSQVSDASEPRARLEAAGRAMAKQEAHLVDVAINGSDGRKGIRELPGAFIVGGADNPDREGLVSYAFDHIPSVDVVAALNDKGIRTHLRKADYFSGSVLEPLNLDSCIRTSFCHYNSKEEILALLDALAEITQK